MPPQKFCKEPEASATECPGRTPSLSLPGRCARVEELLRRALAAADQVAPSQTIVGALVMVKMGILMPGMMFMNW
jgi:hypothetical protein